jgi:hypothetical protein
MPTDITDGKFMMISFRLFFLIVGLSPVGIGKNNKSQEKSTHKQIKQVQVTPA